MITFTSSNGSIILPDPEFNDSVGVDSKVNFRRAMNGTRYTYVRSSAFKKLTLTFNNLDRNKMFEMQIFIKLNKGILVTLLDHNSEVRRGFFDDVTDPFSADARRSGRGGVRNEAGSYTVVFIGE